MQRVFLYRVLTVGGLLVLQLLGLNSAFAGAFHVRAREHYETMTIATGDTSRVYQGFTNTIAAGIEEPYLYQVAVVGSPLLATLHASDPLPGMSKTVQILHLGVEAKAFPLPRILNLFVRVGGYNARLDTRSDLGTLPGASALGAVGYEFDLGGIGLAPEMAWRKIWLRQGYSAQGTAPALGVHFYKWI